MSHVRVHDQSLLFYEISMCIRKVFLVIRQFSFSCKFQEHLFLFQIIIIPSFKFLHRLHLETLCFFLLSLHTFHYCLDLFILLLQNLFFLLSLLLGLLWHLSLMKGQCTSIFLFKFHFLPKSIAHLSLDKSSQMRIRNGRLGLFNSVIEIRLVSSIDRLIK